MLDATVQSTVGGTLNASIVSSANTTVATLAGTPEIGDLWQLLLTVNQNLTVISYEVAATDSLSDIADGLAAQIASATSGKFSASDEGATLIISNYRIPFVATG